MENTTRPAATAELVHVGLRLAQAFGTDAHVLHDLVELAGTDLALVTNPVAAVVLVASVWARSHVAAAHVRHALRQN